MYIPFETLLTLGIIGFYLYDSARLLYFNEVVFSKSTRSWEAICITSRWTIKGKSLLLPNPLTPFFPLISLYWSSSLRKSKSINIDYFIDALKPLSFMSLISMILMILVVPIVIKMFGAGLYLLILFCLIYINIIAMIIYLCIKKSIFDMNSKQLFVFCFDILACPPFSINVVRKLSLGLKLREDAIQFGLKNLSESKRIQLLTSINTKLNEKLEYLDDSIEYKRIKKYQAKIEGLFT
jgi:hypothetical protein